MKYPWIAVALFSLLAFAAGSISFWCLRDAPSGKSEDEDALQWLRREFTLSSETLDRIRRMHESYQVLCEEHCRNIREARSELRRLRENNANAQTITSAERKLRELDHVCTSSLEVHMREVAREIGGEQGQRYLSIVLPRIVHFEHGGAPKIDLENRKSDDGRRKE